MSKRKPDPDTIIKELADSLEELRNWCWNNIAYFPLDPVQNDELPANERAKGIDRRAAAALKKAGRAG